MMEEHVELLPVGTSVLLLGLVSKPELNGQTGTICGLPIAATGRYPVNVADEKLLLKPANLERLSAAGDDEITTLTIEDLMGGLTATTTNVSAPAPSLPTKTDTVLPPPAEAPARAKAPAPPPTAEEPPTPPATLPALPTAPMWGPLVDSGSAWRRVAASRGAVPIGDDDEDEEDGAEEPYDEEDEEDARMAADAALLQAAVSGAPQGGGGFAPLDPSEWRVEGPLTSPGSGGSTTSTSRISNGSAAAAPQPPPHRFDPSLCGGTVQTCDVRTASGLAAARDAVARRVPIHMKGGGAALLGKAAAELGSAQAIGKHLRGRPVSVLFAPGAVGGRFTYYFDENAYEWNLMAPPPVNRRLTLLWDEALLETLKGEGGKGGETAGKGGETAGKRGEGGGTHYVQLSLATRVGGAQQALGANGRTALPMKSPGPPPLLEALQSAVRGAPMGELSEQLGPWQSSMLYVGPSGTLAPCHWDALDNLFTQLGGTKQVLLFPPDTAGMRPFPSDHPYDSRSQVDLEAPTDAEKEALRGRGALATLEAGDALFIPNQWWHHIHASEGSPADGLCISLNCWFNPFEELAVGRLAWPLRPHVHAQVARAAESLLCAALPTRGHAARAFAALAGLLDGTHTDEPPPATATAPKTKGFSRGRALPSPSASGGSGGGGGAAAAATRKLASVRNYVAGQLCAAYGREAAARLCHVYLEPARWSELKRVCFHEAGE